jgi:hypothetical protein
MKRHDSANASAADKAVAKPNVVPKSSSMMDYLDSEQPIALSDLDQLIAKLDDEALLTKFLHANTNFIAVGPLSHRFQESRYFQFRDELCRIDLEIRHRALLGTPEYKAAVKAAHDQAWQLVHIARPCIPIRQSQEAGRQIGSPRDHVVEQDRVPVSSTATALATQTADQGRAEPVAQQVAPPDSTEAAAAAGNAETTQAVVQQETPPASTSAMPTGNILASWRDAMFALGLRRGDPR